MGRYLQKWKMSHYRKEYYCMHRTLCAAIFHHMRHFGLLMHAGTLDENGNHQTKSKTEAIFIPARPMTQEDIDAPTTNIVFGTQYVPFTQEFPILGISSDYRPERRCHRHQ
jgi:hypothetical protein